MKATVGVPASREIKWELVGVLDPGVVQNSRTSEVVVPDGEVVLADGTVT